MGVTAARRSTADHRVELVAAVDPPASRRTVNDRDRASRARADAGAKSRRLHGADAARKNVCWAAPRRPRGVGTTGCTDEDLALSRRVRTEQLSDARTSPSGRDDALRRGGAPFFETPRSSTASRCEARRPRRAGDETGGAHAAASEDSGARPDGARGSPGPRAQGRPGSTCTRCACAAWWPSRSARHEGAVKSILKTAMTVLLHAGGCSRQGVAIPGLTLGLLIPRQPVIGRSVRSCVGQRSRVAPCRWPSSTRSHDSWGARRRAGSIDAARGSRARRRLDAAILRLPQGPGELGGVLASDANTKRAGRDVRTTTTASSAPSKPPCAASLEACVRNLRALLPDSHRRWGHGGRRQRDGAHNVAPPPSRGLGRSDRVRTDDLPAQVSRAGAANPAALTARELANMPRVLRRQAGTLVGDQTVASVPPLELVCRRSGRAFTAYRQVLITGDAVTVDLAAPARADGEIPSGPAGGRIASSRPAARLAGRRRRTRRAAAPCRARRVEHVAAGPAVGGRCRLHADRLRRWFVVHLVIVDVVSGPENTGNRRAQFSETM